MELTRRDALAALASAGIVGGRGVAALARERREERGGERPEQGFPQPRVLDALVATAEVVYPDEVSGIREFVEAYSLGRFDAHPAYREGVDHAVDELEEHARAWYGGPYTTLDVTTREDLLWEMGVDVAEEDPEGTAAERVRFYAVNELLFALYSSPTGGELVGIENPQGHPGGIDSYRRGPR